MVSIIITSKNEARTIGRAVSCFLKQMTYDLRLTTNDFEIVVVAPDKETLNAAQKISDKVRIIQDQDNGKSAAMNLAIKQAKGDILIFSDGDVEIEQKAVEELLKVNAEIVTGRPIITKTLKHLNTKTLKHKTDRYNYWQECLVDMAHKLRSERDKQGEFLLLSGYLFLIKKEIISNFQFSENLLAEDEYLSYWAWDKGYKIRYAPLARVKVKYPDNYGDWVKQKTRTLAGSYQIPMEWKKKIAMRSFSKEAFGGLSMVMNYVKNFKQMYWMKLLFMARLHVWLLAWWKVKILKQQRGKVWKRVESTKNLNI